MAITAEGAPGGPLAALVRGDQRPKVPAFIPVDPNQVQIDTATGNIGVLPTASKLATATNTFNQSELERLSSMALPFYSQIKQKVGENILNNVSGIIPESVMQNIQRAMAAYSVYGGFGGTGRQANLTGGKFAEETFKRMETGMDSAQRWLSTSLAPRFDVSNMFFSPGTRLQHAVSERDAAWNVQWLKNQIKALGNPITNAIADDMAWEWSSNLAAANTFKQNYAASSGSSLGSMQFGGMGGGGGASVRGGVAS